MSRTASKTLEKEVGIMGIPKYMRFPSAEYERRCDRARELMGKENLGGLFITEGANYTYFSGGTKDFSYARPTLMLLPRNGDPVVLGQRFPEENRKAEIWVKDIRIYDTMLGVPFEMVVEAMKNVGLSKGRVGAELGYEQRLGISFHDFMRLKELLPKVEFVDAAGVFWGVRMIKSPQEAGRHRRACQITGRAYESLFSSLHEGMTEKEIVYKFLKLQIDLGGSSPWGWINSCPENYSFTGGGPTDREIQKGNQVWVDGGCSYLEYGSDFCCAGTVGPPSYRQRKMQDMVIGITRTLADAVRPGIRACDIDAYNSSEWEKLGYDYSKINFGGGRIGHGMGLSVTEPPHLASYDKTVIRPGMVFTIEPGITTDFGCFQAEMDILVTQNGCEILSEMNRELRVIQV